MGACSVIVSADGRRSPRSGATEKAACSCRSIRMRSWRASGPSSYLTTAAAIARLLSLRRRLLVGYYRTRRLLPRPLQIWLRRRFARLQARSAFPRWPVESALARLLRADACDP